MSAWAREILLARIALGVHVEMERGEKPALSPVDVVMKAEAARLAPLLDAAEAIKSPINKRPLPGSVIGRSEPEYGVEAPEQDWVDF